jgi:hypothetical protein
MIFRTSGIITIITGVIAIVFSFKDCFLPANHITASELIVNGATNQTSSIINDSVQINNLPISKPPVNSNNSEYKKQVDDERADYDNINSVEGKTKIDPLKSMGQERIANNENISMKKVNKNYGFTKEGIIYIHKSRIPISNGDDNLYLCYQKNHWDTIATKMNFDGNYYYYQSDYARNKSNLNYCFYGRIIHQWIPEYWLDEGSSLIDTADVCWNGFRTGHNFCTGPQEFYPGDKH